jgi:hypothetical protein
VVVVVVCSVPNSHNTHNYTQFGITKVALNYMSRSAKTKLDNDNESKQ